MIDKDRNPKDTDPTDIKEYKLQGWTRDEILRMYKGRMGKGDEFGG